MINILKELEKDHCPWDFRGDDVSNPVISFALCHDCPMCFKLTMKGKASDKKTHSVIVICEKED